MPLIILKWPIILKKFSDQTSNTEHRLLGEWKDWKEAFEKVYETAEEEIER